MKHIYEIIVFGAVDGIEYCGGWSIVFKSFNKEDTKRKLIEYRKKYGKDNVMLNMSK